ncbi:MAG: class I SAM-dependent methyltransferase family protein [bacterium]|nr:class I SAM-dependent methyltransferase family protein [bacterium]
MVDSNKNINYETNSWLNILRIPLLLILNALPKKLAQKIFLAFSASDGDPTTVFYGATTYKALETLYTFRDRRDRGETTFFDFFWENFLNNARAIRNRLQLVKQELHRAIADVRQGNEPVRILSLGGGSARPVLEAVRDEEAVKVRLVDISRDAIDYSKALAASFNLNGQIEWRRGFAQSIGKHCKDFDPNIVEMVGLLDYLTREQAIDLLAKIHNKLLPGGWLITCNIRPNIESPFVAKGINWPMIYRKPDELGDILVKAGFSIDKIRIVYEPLKIHGLAIAQKVV